MRRLGWPFTWGATGSEETAATIWDGFGHHIIRVVPQMQVRRPPSLVNPRFSGVGGIDGPPILDGLRR